MTNQNKDILVRAEQTLKIESDSILGLLPNLNDDFIKAVNLILNCKGKLVLTGIGKSGLIARKISSTFSSTGTPSLYLHPAESSHGDLGVVTSEDLILAISYGGEAVELNAILKFAARNGIKLIALTGKPESTLAKSAQAVLNVKIEKEACPLNLAPTSSSTATLAMGDALAMSVLDQRGFKSENFAQYHPSGSLGVRLQKISDVMHKGQTLPLVNPKTSLKEILTKMTHESVRGAAGVIDEKNRLVGIITDGDIRRFLEKNQNPFNFVAQDIMTRSPKTVEANEFAEKALYLMEQSKIQVLIVLDQTSQEPLRPVGMVTYQDVLTNKSR